MLTARQYRRSRKINEVIGSRKMPAFDQCLCALDRSAGPSANRLGSRAAVPRLQAPVASK